MTGLEIIEEIKRLPTEEQTKVIEFTHHLAHERQLTTEELMSIARQMVETTDPAEGDKLQKRFVRGFYGWNTNA